MFTVIESPLFAKLAGDYWSEEERGAFAAFVAQHPEAGDVIPGSGGVRKIRWARKGAGKRSGVRVLYFNRLPRGEIWLLLIYAKNARDDIPAHIVKAVRKEIDDA